ncbi:tyrosine-protein phosphatase [Dysgonomonas sp. Marseille-P4361]|uniref:tyrosine-protein phosphatase n=1 Tax=Dysgonomonas sp. Marseille-P4361 TaxID=2161820 RepID=UPI000D54EB00|nr:tyrosine-protein phosphatase [Dysgonomonas sp. Marseille-P4361]
MNKSFFIIILGFFLITSCKKESVQKAEYSGMDISKDVNIIRDKTTKSASMQIYTQGEWSIYGGPSIDQINLESPIAQGTNSGTFPIDVPSQARSYFQVVTEHGKAIAADRHLPMTGGYNFRDLGGYRTQEGKYVKWGKIFRSDDLHNLTKDDLQYLAEIPIVSIVDFRSEEECTQLPDKNPSSVKENYKLSISPGNLMNAFSLSKEDITSEKIDSLMKEMNILLVTDPDCIDRYKKFFELLQSDSDTPLMFHCSAGKDRTGMGAALILSALGVDEQTIMKDYLLSNVYLANKYSKIKAENPNLSSLFEVKSEFLQAGLDRIKKDHGTVENYLTKVLNVDIAKMREIYLY